MGKEILMYYPDGRTGWMYAEISNWVGKAYKIPRPLIKTCLQRSELRTTSVYLLFGTDSETLKPKVYVGESEQVHIRMLDHLNKKDWWNEAVIFISKDSNLNKAFIKYLEHRLHEIAVSVKRFATNQDIPTKSCLSESNESTMEEFIEYIRWVTFSMGYKVFEPIIERTNDEIQEHPTETIQSTIFHCSGRAGSSGKGIITSEGFVVLEGTIIAKNNTPTYESKDPRAKIRYKLIDEGIIVLNEDGDYIFVQDYLFNSPSGASSLIFGRSSSGRGDWIDDNGKNMNQRDEIEELKNNRDDEILLAIPN